MTATPSLFRRLLAGFITVVMAIWLCIVAMAIYEHTVLQARNTAAENKGWTRQILLNVRSVASDPGEMARVAGQIETLRTEMLREVNYWPRPVLLQVWLKGQRVYSSAGGLPDNLALPTPDGPALGPRWTTWTARDAITGVVVRRDAMYDGRWLFTGSGAAYFLAPLLYSLPFLILPAWIIIRRGLEPLKAVVHAIGERSGSDLSPLPISPYHELAPVVVSVNSLMQRLTARIERDKEFLSDAAHELKTPLAVIQSNAHLLWHHRDDPQRMRQADAGLRQGVARATHTVHQLLALERAASDTGSTGFHQLDLAQLVCERLALAAPLAIQRDIDIELDATGPCVLPLHLESMVSLLDNIIGNAVKYSPDGACVKVALRSQQDGCELSVCDQGTGIPAKLRGKVFERFYRVPGQQQSGSGLGLAIAERAAQRNRASITLRDGPHGKGLEVIIRFCAPAAFCTSDIQHRWQPPT